MGLFGRARDSDIEVVRLPKRGRKRPLVLRPEVEFVLYILYTILFILAVVGTVLSCMEAWRRAIEMYSGFLDRLCSLHYEMQSKCRCFPGLTYEEK